MKGAEWIGRRFKLISLNQSSVPAEQGTSARDREGWCYFKIEGKYRYKINIKYKSLCQDSSSETRSHQSLLLPGTSCISICPLKSIGSFATSSLVLHLHLSGKCNFKGKSGSAVAFWCFWLHPSCIRSISKGPADSQGSAWLSPVAWTPTTLPASVQGLVVAFCYY